MENQLNIVNQLRHWNKGNFNTSDLKKLSLAGWKTFACKATSLQRKTDILFRRLEQIVFNPMFNLSETTANLKNILKKGKSMDLIEIKKISTGRTVCSIFYRDPETGLAGVLNSKGKLIISGTWSETKSAIMEGALKLPISKGISIGKMVETVKSTTNSTTKRKPVKATIIKKSNKSKTSTKEKVEA